MYPNEQMEQKIQSNSILELGAFCHHFDIQELCIIHLCMLENENKYCFTLLGEASYAPAS